VHNPETLHIKTLSGDWCDKDLVMLHACFQLLTDFVEQEKAKDIVDWTHNEETKSAGNEIDELYRWWKQRVLMETDDSIDPIWTEGVYENDNDMLTRLIKIRKFLWT